MLALEPLKGLIQYKRRKKYLDYGLDSPLVLQNVRKADVVPSVSMERLWSWMDSSWNGFSDSTVRGLVATVLS